MSRKERRLSGAIVGRTFSKEGAITRPNKLTKLKALFSESFASALKVISTMNIRQLNHHPPQVGFHTVAQISYPVATRDTAALE